MPISSTLQILSQNVQCEKIILASHVGGRPSLSMQAFWPPSTCRCPVLDVHMNTLSQVPLKFLLKSSTPIENQN